MSVDPGLVISALNSDKCIIRGYIDGNSLTEIELKMLKKRLDGLVQHVTRRIVESFSSKDGIAERAKEGLIRDTLHDRGRPTYFLDKAPGQVPIETALAKIDISKTVDDLNANATNRLTYHYCRFCDRITSDEPLVHALCCVNWPNDVDPITVTFTSMSVDLICRLCMKTAEDVETGLQLSLPFITAYTLETPIYRRLNWLLRSVRQPGPQREFSERFGTYFVGLDADLRRLPPFRGTVYRGINVRIAESYYSPGSIITWDALSSSSDDATVARSFLGEAAEPVGTLFVINSISGRSIKTFSSLPEENEVLFPAGAQFRVVRRVEVGLRNLLEAALRVSLLCVDVIELQEVVLRTQDQLTSALSLDQRELWSARIEHVFDTAEYRRRVVSYAAEERLATNGREGKDFRYRVKLDGRVVWQAHLPVSDVLGAHGLVMDATPGCEPQVLKLILNGINPQRVHPKMIREWIERHAAVRAGTAAWLLSWAVASNDQVLQSCDDTFRREVASSLAGAGESAIPGEETIRLIERVKLAAGLEYSRLVMRCCERGSAAVFRWLGASTGASELLQLKFKVFTRGGNLGALRQVPLLTAAVLRAGASPFEAELMFGAVLSVLVPRNAGTISGTVGGDVSSATLVGSREKNEDIPVGGGRGVETALTTGSDTRGSAAVPGFDINAADANGRSALYYAAELGVSAIVEVLLAQRSIDVNASDPTGRTALMAAAEYGHVSVLKLLLSAQPPANVLAATHDAGIVPLMYAAQCGNEKAVRLLLARGAKVDSRSTANVSALYMAAENGHADVMRVLLDQPEGRKAIDSETRQHTPLQIAAHEGHESVVRLLLEHGAAASTATGGGETALHLASQQGHVQCVRELLEKISDINAAIPDRNGHTPLTLAAENGHEAVVKVLLESGADDAITLTDGQTARELARKKGHDPVVTVLDAHSAR